MPTDITTLAVAGVALLPLLVWLVQVIREATYMASRFIPLVAIAVAFVLLAVAVLTPDPWRTVVVGALGLAWAANTSVRFVKRGSQA